MTKPALFFVFALSALIGPNQGFAESRSDLICTINHQYQSDAETGKLHEPNRSWEVGKRFVVNRFSGEISGFYSTYQWDRVRVHATGSSDGEYFAYITYERKPKLVGKTLETSGAINFLHLRIAPPDEVTIFTLMTSFTPYTGTCEWL